MKKVAFVLTLEFADDIQGSDVLKHQSLVNELAKNIVGSLVHTINHSSGLVPDDAETFTTKITIDSAYHNVKIERPIRLDDSI
jgi:hypothetical protein